MKPDVQTFDFDFVRDHTGELVPPEWSLAEAAEKDWPARDGLLDWIGAIEPAQVIRAVSFGNGIGKSLAEAMSAVAAIQPRRIEAVYVAFLRPQETLGECCTAIVDIVQPVLSDTAEICFSRHCAERFGVLLFAVACPHTTGNGSLDSDVVSATTRLY